MITLITLLGLDLANHLRHPGPLGNQRLNLFVQPVDLVAGLAQFLTHRGSITRTASTPLMAASSWTMGSGIG